MQDLIINILKNGDIGVMPTDTIYGLVGSALNKKAVRRIYQVKKRAPKKPFIILISSLDNLKLFDMRIGEKEKKVLKKVWPGKVSVILPCNSEKFSYLHRGTKTLAFRLPAKRTLISLLQKTGPLVAPSANPEGLPPAKNMEEAKRYFGEKVFPEQSRRIDFYLTGRSGQKSSKLIKIHNGEITVLRK